MQELRQGCQQRQEPLQARKALIDQAFILAMFFGDVSLYLHSVRLKCNVRAVVTILVCAEFLVYLLWCQYLVLVQPVVCQMFWA